MTDKEFDKMTDEEIDKMFYDMAMHHRVGSPPEKFMLDGKEVAFNMRMETKMGEGNLDYEGLFCEFFIHDKFTAVYHFPFIEYAMLKRGVEYSFGTIRGSIEDKQKSFFSSEPSDRTIVISPPYTRDDLIHWLLIIELTKGRT